MSNLHDHDLRSAEGLRECGCPLWIIRCAHDPDGRLLLLVDRDRVPYEVARQWLRSTDPRFYLAPTRVEFDCLDAANAAFERAEAELLQRGDA